MGGARGGILIPPRENAWNPEQYQRFRAEREQPFWDLVELIDAPPRGRVVDLGCGTGTLTRELHLALGASETVGVDSSPAMLARAAEIRAPGLRFELADITRWTPRDPLDVVFSNAALQWIDDHPALFSRLRSLLAPDGVLAVQMPANHDHPSHVVAAQVALEEPFASATGGYARISPVRAPETYAELLHSLAFEKIHVRLQVYCHALTSSADVVEWVRGTLLTDYEQRMPDLIFREFLESYRARLLEAIGDRRPYLLVFKRILLCGVAGS